MRLCPLFMFLIGLQAVLPLRGQDAYPAVTQFAQSITGTIWDLRGTFGLKHLRYDGANVRELRAGNRPAGAYEHAFVDVGVLRLNFRGANTAWYFFSDDLKYVTPTTIAGEMKFKVMGGVAKPVVNFPKDIEGVVWESEPDNRKLSPTRVRWTGKHLEIGVLNQQDWRLDRETPAVANRRVFEVLDPEGTPLWFAFSADGKEAWMLQVDNIFGGHPQKNPGQAAQTEQQTGLTLQLNDLANHAEDLAKDGEKMRVDTLRRQFQRKLKDTPATAKAVEERLATK